MHYLSHFYSEQPQNSPYFVVGLAMPDLTPGFSKVYNSVIKNSVVAHNRELELIQQGILSHYGADKRFHQSRLFNDFMALTLKAFLKEELNRERLRLSVLAHVAVEMMIDRQIVLEYEQLCVEYYDILNRAEDRVLTLYFDEMRLDYEMGVFMHRFHFFRERRFLFLFKNIENVAYALKRVYASVAGIEFTPIEESKFVAALNNIDNTMRYSWKQILKA
jgi:hypothetical protein